VKKVKTALFFLSILSAPFYSFALLTIGGRSIEFSWFFAVLLILLFLAELTIMKKKLLINRISVALIVLNVAAILSLLGLLGHASGNYVADFLTTYVQILLVTVFFFAIANMDIQWRQILCLFRAWMLVALLIAIYGVYQFFALSSDLPFARPVITNVSRSSGQISTGAYLGVYGLARSTSIFPEPSALASYLLGPILLLSIVLFRQNEKLVLFKSTIAKWLLLSTLGVAFIFAFSLGAFAALLATGLLFLLKYRGYFLRRGFKPLLFILMVLLVINYSINVLYGMNYLGIIFVRLKILIHQIITSIGIGAEGSTAGPGTSYFTRLDMIVTGLSVWLKHPFFGVGLNNFGNVAGNFRWTATPFQTLADQGILGLSAYVFFFWAVFRSLKEAKKRLEGFEDRKTAMIGQTLLTGLTYVVWSQFVFFFFSDTWFAFNQFIYFALIGLLVNIIHRESSASNNIEKRSADILSKGGTQ